MFLIYKEVIMGPQKGYKPGEKAPDSAQYQIIGPRGSKGAERTVVKDKTRESETA
jgi:hypothetical protein